MWSDSTTARSESKGILGKPHDSPAEHSSSAQPVAAVLRLDGARLYRHGRRCRFRDDHCGLQWQLPLAFLLMVAGHRDRRHRWRPGASGAGQEDDPELRRRAPRRYRRLPDLRVRSRPAAVSGRTPAAGWGAARCGGRAAEQRDTGLSAPMPRPKTTFSPAFRRTGTSWRCISTRRASPPRSTPPSCSC